MSHARLIGGEHRSTGAVVASMNSKAWRRKNADRPNRRATNQAGSTERTAGGEPAWEFPTRSSAAGTRARRAAATKGTTGPAAERGTDPRPAAADGAATRDRHVSGKAPRQRVVPGCDAILLNS